MVIPSPKWHHFKHALFLFFFLEHWKPAYKKGKELWNTGIPVQPELKLQILSHEDYNPREIRMDFSCPYAYKRESNMGGTVGAPIRLKHNVPRPYHGPGKISSMEAYKR
jgi:hypothetical protein